MNFKKPMNTLYVGEIMSQVSRLKRRTKTLKKTKKKEKMTLEAEAMCPRHVEQRAIISQFSSTRLAPPPPAARVLF